ncbi:hypothetical protein [Seonamhaeicola sp.]|uniref:hypothetical protein n=1 Tax=Seonamhaeicola sp. TaxID=1912245 RepID=UPI002625377B|nr:hypothetical protein [Seonamhaeicola sp.]
MQRAIQFKTLLILLMLPLFAVATVKHEGKYTKKKTINKEYSVNKNATLKVDNSYGNIDVVTWNEDRIVFEITITTSGNDEEKVQEKLDGISVEFNASPSLVSAETKFGKKGSGSWWNWGKKSKISINVHYIVKIPITNNVNLNNDYGSINLDKLEGVANINCDYGKITTKELMADNNSFNFDYTKNCHFEYIKSGKINADYSGFTVSKTNNLNINADYTNCKIEIAENINYNCDYGNLSVDNVNNIKGNGDYVTTVIGDVYKSVSLRGDYGTIKIGQLNENTNSVTVTGDYMGIKIGYAPNYNFSFNINLDYAAFSSSGLEFTKKNSQSHSKQYEGYHGSASTGNFVKISSDYGGVSLKKN